MNALLLEPHQDDATLFAAFTCLRYKPKVITILGSKLQEDRGTGITNGVRELENHNALAELGCVIGHEQWPERDNAPDWDATYARLHRVNLGTHYEVVFAPAIEDGGHEQHTAVGELALGVFGERVQHYLTYKRGHGKTKGKLVEYEPEWVSIKHRALAWHESQIAERTTQSWFMGDLYEYMP